jgi:vacuolar-type H+-ATPase subunit I/STV1
VTKTHLKDRPWLTALREAGVILRMDVTDEDLLEDNLPDDGDAAGDDGDTDDSTPDEDPFFKVKVDGEEVEVPLKELLAGYSRQDHFTRKSQELAAEVALAKRLRENPEELFAELGYEVATDDEEDPRLKALSSKLAQIEKAQRDAANNEALREVRSRAQAAVDAMKAENANLKLNTSADDLLNFANAEGVFNLTAAAELLATRAAKRQRETNRTGRQEANRKDPTASGARSDASLKPNEQGKSLDDLMDADLWGM